MHVSLSADVLLPAAGQHLVNLAPLAELSSQSCAVSLPAGGAKEPAVFGAAVRGDASQRPSVFADGGVQVSQTLPGRRPPAVAAQLGPRCRAVLRVVISRLHPRSISSRALDCLCVSSLC